MIELFTESALNRHPAETGKATATLLWRMLETIQDNVEKEKKMTLTLTFTPRTTFREITKCCHPAKTVRAMMMKLSGILAVT